MSENTGGTLFVVADDPPSGEGAAVGPTGFQGALRDALGRKLGGIFIWSGAWDDNTWRAIKATAIVAHESAGHTTMAVMTTVEFHDAWLQWAKTTDAPIINIMPKP